MIHTIHGEPIEIIGPAMMNLLDPTTMSDPIVRIRSLNDSSWVRQSRLSNLKADGGMEEIGAAIKKATEAPAP